MTESSRPEAQAVFAALTKELETAAVKVEMSMNKLVTPLLKTMTNELEVGAVPEECQVD